MAEKSLLTKVFITCILSVMESVDTTSAPQQLRIKFASLGLVVLDEIHFPSKATQKDVVGGSGSYGTSYALPSIVSSK